MSRPSDEIRYPSKFIPPHHILLISQMILVASGQHFLADVTVNLFIINLENISLQVHWENIQTHNDRSDYHILLYFGVS